MSQIRHCKDCGFLALRNRRTFALDEADEFFRDWGRPSTVPDTSQPQEGNEYAEPKDYPYERMPRCSVMAFDLEDEVYERGREVVAARKAEGIPPPLEGFEVSEVGIIVNRGRYCKSWTKWHPGFTPKEHSEMIEMIDKRWERKWRIIELIVLGFIAVVVAGLFTILAAFIERGAIP